MSFCIELFCVVTLQYQILVRIAIAYFIIEKKESCATALAGHRAAILFNGKLVTSCNSFSYLIPQTKPIKIFQFQAIRQLLSLIHCLYTLYPEESHTCNKNN